ncbi:phosphoglucomutase [Oceanotoga teriensis]|uniref:Phosphoglucomutase n=2 Tax=Oceanotoga teriensis TaxID=515440 RepID=A0AA45C5U8_9BACT|nr:phospho-sugar mutase [Oceanotoga teriensis]PWJ90044.1 phosphoglucomutase [Oceanotoga teriensis]
MMNYKEKYLEWLNSPVIDEQTKQELLSIKDDEEEIKNRFIFDLEFGTAGLRGILGAGSNRMNIYTVAKATQGLADYINFRGKEYAKKGVAIAYDVRHFSKEFSEIASSVLTANGIKVYLFEDIRPTPELSFAIRYFKATSGIVITASHNPKEYNGYKVYWEEGSQILSEVADGITNNIKNIKSFEEIKYLDLEKAKEENLLTIIGKEVDDEYTRLVKSLAIRDEELDKDIKIIYTPLNGTGNIPVRRVLKERGFKNVIVVPEQENPDPNFTTVGYPNPEDTKAFKYSESLGKKENAEILIATDPDCDRLAVEVKDGNGEYIPLNGNQTGAILINYILESKNEKNLINNDGFIVKSIVTGDLGKVIAESYGVKTYETLTGFKNICGKENELLKQNKTFHFGYEESIGYVTGTFVRDKDGVISSMFLSEAAAYYKTKGKTLLDVLEEIYIKYGYYRENNFSIVLEGLEGKEKISNMMINYRKNFPKNVNDIKLIKYVDYQEEKEYDIINNKNSEVDIPKSNVLRFWFEDGSWYAVRPSGTEPKIKVYIYSKGKTLKESENKLKLFKESILKELNNI